jgi:hypothetical protein
MAVWVGGEGWVSIRSGGQFRNKEASYGEYNHMGGRERQGL